MSIALSVPAAAQRPSAPPSTGDTLYLTHFDVGQGDATLITTARGRRILIDAGKAGGAIAARLREVGIDTLDLVVSSHNHEDHIGGMPAVFDQLVVRAYMDNGVPHTTNVYATTIALAQVEPGLRYLEATDRTVTVADVTLRILPPSRVRNDQNNNSVGVLVEYGAFKALYTGDSETRELDWWIDRNYAKRVTLLKAAHHGSRNGATDAWIAATRPAIVIFSVGATNSYGHPSADVYEAWKSTGAKLYLTAVHGTVQVNAMRDGSFMVKTYPDAAAKWRRR